MTELENLITEHLNNNYNLRKELVKNWTPYLVKKDDFTFTTIQHISEEDEGSDYFSVVKIEHILHPNEHKLAKFQGWYQSYPGWDYETWSFVEPVQKTITVYE